MLHSMKVSDYTYKIDKCLIVTDGREAMKLHSFGTNKDSYKFSTN